MNRKAILAFVLVVALRAQQITGGITGTVTDASGASVSAAVVEAQNVDTNLSVKVLTHANGSYQIPNLPAGTYHVSFSKEGFKTETHTSILVQGDRTTAVAGKLEVGTVSTTVEVTATPLLNQTDTTSGYVLDSQTINNTPLATGSFTQLAILSPGPECRFRERIG